jgi:hypothetical protein
MILTEDDLQRITIIKGSPVPDIKCIPSCFGVINPRDIKCFKKGKPVCKIAKACLIFTAEFLEIDNAEDSSESFLQSEIKRLFDNREELSDKLKFRLATAIKEANKSEYKDIVQPQARTGTARYYAELFFLKIGGSIMECAEYVEKHHGKSCDSYNT